MPFHLIHIRVKQFRRIIKGLGIYAILIAGTFLFFVYASFIYHQKGEFAYAAGSLILCFSLQRIRPDIHFVYKHLTNPYLEMYSEYALLVFPFTVTSLFTHSWYYFFLTYLLLALVPLYKPVFFQKTALKNLSRFIPASDFEWISGVRKMYMYLIPVYLLALACSWIKIAPLFFLWMLTTVYISFYEEGESLQILNAKNENASQLLFRKSVHHTRFLFLICLPVLAINTILLPEYWILNVLFLITQTILLLFCIYFKYAMYIPAVKMKANNVMMGMVSIGSLIPYFFLVPLLMAFWYYFKAKRNLHLYLHD